jgi:hypothetical protein
MHALHDREFPGADRFPSTLLEWSNKAVQRMKSATVLLTPHVRPKVMRRVYQLANS